MFLFLQDMLTAGIIVTSRSAPVVLVPKMDSTWRLCVDFRKLNEVSKPDPFPMPRVDELLDTIGNSRYITTLDLSKGYWQLPMSEGSREKTALRREVSLHEDAFWTKGCA